MSINIYTYINFFYGKALNIYILSVFFNVYVLNELLTLTKITPLRKRTRTY